MNHCVLVVEDHIDTALAVRTLLSAWGQETHSAFNGAHALEIAQEYQPDVVWLDLGLPDIDGLTLAKQLRKLYPHVVLIAVTARIESEAHAQKAGIDYFFTKPLIEMARVRRLIEQGVHRANNRGTPLAMSNLQV